MEIWFFTMTNYFLVLWIATNWCSRTYYLLGCFIFDFFFGGETVINLGATFISGYKSMFVFSLMSSLCYSELLALFWYLYVFLNLRCIFCIKTWKSSWIFQYDLVPRMLSNRISLGFHCPSLDLLKWVNKILYSFLRPYFVFQ